MGLKQLAAEWMLKQAFRLRGAPPAPTAMDRRVARQSARRGVPRPGFGQTYVGFGSPIDEPDRRMHEAFQANAAVHRAVEIRKDTLAKLPLRFYRLVGEKKVEILRQPGNIVDLWAKANDQESSWNIVEQLQASLDLSGNAFLFLELNGAAEVTSLSTLPAHFVTPIVKKGEREIDYFRLVWFGKVYKLPADQVVHIKAFAHGLGIVGMSPLRAAWTAYRTNKYGSDFNMETLRRGGEFNGVLTQIEGRGSMNDPVKRRRLQLQQKKRFRTPLEHRTALTLPPGVKFERSQLTPGELRLLEIMQVSREQVYEVYGVPLWLVGSQAAHGSGGLGLGTAAESQERIFWDYTMDAVKGRMEQSLTELLLKRFDETWCCEFDTSMVYALKSAFLASAKAVKDAVGRTVMLPNEGRKLLGLDPLDDPTFDEPYEAPAPFGGAPGDPAAGDPKPGANPKQEDPPAPVEPQKSHKPRVMRRDHEARRATLHGRMEREAASASRYIERLLDAQEKRSVDALLSRMRSVEAREAEDVLGNLLPDDPQDLQTLEEMIRGVIANVGPEALYEVVQSADFKLNTARAVAYIQRQGHRALLMNDTTRARLLDEVSKAVQAGESKDGLVSVIRAFYGDRRANVRDIARTETASAFNWATVEAWRQSDVVQGKIWVAILDDRTRESHADMDGTTVPLDQPFMLTGADGVEYAVDHPGDAGLPPEEAINCRCAVDYDLAPESQQASESAEVWLRRVLQAGKRARLAETNGKVHHG